MQPKTALKQAQNQSFTQQAWNGVADVYAKITELDFVREIAAGTLKKEIFVHYLIQDSLYLVDFARALAILAARAESPDGILHLLDGAREAIATERSLHLGQFEKYGISKTAYERAEKSPTTELYTSFLLNHATQSPFEVGIAAIVPCFVIYQKVGQHILDKSVPNNPYAEWITTYSGDFFEESVKKMAAYADELASKAGEENLSRMFKAYTRSTEMEWIFWDGAYKRNTWSI